MDQKLLEFSSVDQLEHVKRINNSTSLKTSTLILLHKITLHQASRHHDSQNGINNKESYF